MKNIYLIAAMASLLPATAAANYPSSSYSLADNGLTLQKWNGAETTVDMNSDPVLAAVTRIANSAFERKGVTSVVVGNNVTELGMWAFFDCSELTEISLPSSLTTIKNSAFSGCTALAGINLPASLTTLGNSTFYHCTSLPEATVPQGISEIPAGCFNSCSSLSALSLPEGLLSIGEEAFKECTSLTSVTLPQSLTLIDAYAFEDCSDLASVTFGSSIEEIGSSAFSGAGLTSLDLSNAPATLSTGWNSFQNCTSLAEVSLPVSDQGIGSGMLQGCTSLTQIVIPDSWESIPVKLCNGCSSLQRLEIGSSVTHIKNTSFFDCTSLEEIEWNEAVTTIDWNAFYGIALTTLRLPATVETIDDYAFSSLPSLTGVSLGSAVTMLGQECFSMCPLLTSFYCNAAIPPTLGSYCFYGSNPQNATLYVPAESISAYSAAAQWNEFGHVADIYTGITAPDAEENSRPLYDLLGRRITSPAKGSIFISGNRPMITIEK